MINYYPRKQSGAAKALMLFTLLFTGIINAQNDSLTLSWDKMGCQSFAMSTLPFDHNFSNANCLKVCPKSESVYRISGESAANIASIEWSVSGGEARITTELSTPIIWDETADGAIQIAIAFKDSTHVQRNICIDKTESSLMLGWDKIGCQLNKDNVSEIKFDHNFSSADCLKVCPESKVTYELSGKGLGNVETVHWDIAGGTVESPDKPSTVVTWNNDLSGAIKIAIRYTNGTSVQRTICVSKVPSSLLLDWEKLEKSVCQIKYDNSPDNADILTVYPESTALYRLSGKDVEHVTATDWSVSEGGHVYRVDKLTTLITWDDTEKSVLLLKIHYDNREAMERKITVLRAQPQGNNMAQNTVVFDYDTAGNQIKRSFIYLAKGKDYNTTKPVRTTQKPLLKSDLYDDISYYPNPVRSELYVEWTLAKGQSVQNLELYDLNGRLMKSFHAEANANHKTINFESFPSGMYDLLLQYNDGQTKNLKIVKQ